MIVKQRNLYKAKTAVRQKSMLQGYGILLCLAILACFAAVSAQAFEKPGHFADLVEDAQASVVKISKVKNLVSQKGLPQFFGNDKEKAKLQGQFLNAQKGNIQTLGSGFFISSDGYILTSYGTVRNSKEFMITDSNGTVFKATVKGVAKNYDLALLKVDEKKKFPMLKWGDSKKVRLGDWSLVVGNAANTQGSITAGIISGTNIKPSLQSALNFERMFQINAPFNKGLNGSPMLNMDGDVIGMATGSLAMFNRQANVGFAIPSAEVRPIIEQLKKHGKIRRGWLGVSIKSINSNSLNDYGYDYRYGAEVTKVEKDAPSEKAGVKRGDIIVKWDGQAMNNWSSLSKLVSNTPVDKKVQMVVLRKNGDRYEEITLDVITGLYPSDEESQAWLDEKAEKEAAIVKREAELLKKEAEIVKRQAEKAKQAAEMLKAKIKTAKSFGGMRVASLTGTFINLYGYDDSLEGVLVIDVEENSEAFERGLRQGMVIQRIASEEVETENDVRDALEDLSEQGKSAAVLLVVMPGGQKTFMSIKVKDFYPAKEE